MQRGMLAHMAQLSPAGKEMLSPSEQARVTNEMGLSPGIGVIPGPKPWAEGRDGLSVNSAGSRSSRGPGGGNKLSPPQHGGLRSKGGAAGDGNKSSIAPSARQLMLSPTGETLADMQARVQAYSPPPSPAKGDEEAPILDSPGENKKPSKPSRMPPPKGLRPS